MTTTSSMRMKLGPVEFECTASEEFLKVEFPVLVTSMAQLYREHFVSLDSANTNTGDFEEGKADTGVAGQQRMGMISISAKLKVESCTELVLAAALHLVRTGQKTFSRAQLLERMREATGFFKKNYASGNLSQSIKSLLTSGKLLDQAADTYALNSATGAEMEDRLAQP